MNTKTRLEQICDCMTTLEQIRSTYSMTEEEMNKLGFTKCIVEVGECDTIGELHRLLYETT